MEYDTPKNDLLDCFVCKPLLSAMLTKRLINFEIPIEFAKF